MSEKELINSIEMCLVRNNPQCKECPFSNDKPIVTCSELLKECLDKVKELKNIKDGE